MNNKKKTLSYSALPPIGGWRILLITVSLVVIALVWAITISPIEFVRFERDRQRVRDAHTLTEILEKIEKQSPRAFRGKLNIVYVSLPDSDLNCSHWNLPPLADGYAYRCVPLTDYRQVNGAGWLPVDFTVFTEKSFSSLPVDPLNGQRGKDPISGKNKLFFYQYTQGSFALTAVMMESKPALSYLSEIGGSNRGYDFNNFIGGQPKSDLQMELFDSSLTVGTSIKPYLDSRPKPERQERIKDMEKRSEFYARNFIQPTEQSESDKAVQADELISSFIKWRLEKPGFLPLEAGKQPAIAPPIVKPVKSESPSTRSASPPISAEEKTLTDGVFKEFDDFINPATADLGGGLRIKEIKKQEKTFAEMVDELQKQKPELRREFLQSAWQGFCQSRGREFDEEKKCCRKPGGVN